MLDTIARFSRRSRVLAHGDYQDAKHLADYVALISRVIFISALSAIILRHASGATARAFLYYPLALGMAVLVLHLMKHIYWMTYDYVSSWFGSPESDLREVLVFVVSVIATMVVILGITGLYIDILTSTINIGAWITTTDQP
ncbi:hypothetical protein DFR48_101735 [Ciceribacter lividus]|uniref:Uncharacterized protein n=1 Tax=Ciceribacter lividus TaxID=1197950 RepID=A0A6I7HXF1_9HYPH|nr:hypothetical protein [Ciceribacter lividus]RCW28717.1 hypothetical protein DFR48_101735 [Ciceribacter lividus]